MEYLPLSFVEVPALEEFLTCTDAAPRGVPALFFMVPVMVVCDKLTKEYKRKTGRIKKQCLFKNFLLRSLRQGNRDPHVKADSIG